MSATDVILFLLVYLWWVVPLLAAVIIVLVLAVMRRIANKVAYIRGGRTIEWKRCTIQASNITFKVEPKQKAITLPIIADPYINYSGLVARRIFVVVEGQKGTTNLPNRKDGGIVVGRKYYQQVPATGAINPQLTVASSTMGMFENSLQRISALLPKSKGDILLTIVIVIACFFAGLTWGHLILP